MPDQIQFKILSDGSVYVYFGKHRTGHIRKMYDEWVYYPRGARSGGYGFPTLEECKRDVAGDDPGKDLSR